MIHTTDTSLSFTIYITNTKISEAASADTAKDLSDSLNKEIRSANRLFERSELRFALISVKGILRSSVARIAAERGGICNVY